MRNTIVFAILGAAVGICFSFLDGGSMLVCGTYLSGESPLSPPTFRPIYDITQAHLMFCLAQKGVLSIVVILLASLIPLAWLGAIASALVYVPRFVVLGAALGVVSDLYTLVTRQNDNNDNDLKGDFNDANS